MNKLTSDEKINILFKKLNNKSSTNNDIPYYQELYESTPVVIPDKQIFANKIPNIAPIELNSVLLDDLGNNIENSTVGKTSNNGIIKKFVKLELNYISGSAIGTSSSNYTAISFYSEHLKHAISFSTDINGSYLYKLYRYSGEEIVFGEGDWIVDNNSGVLTFYGEMNIGLNIQSHVDINKPVSITFYKYIGVMGMGNLDLTEEGINLSGNVNISENLTLSSNANLININLYNHTTLPDNPENIIIKHNNDLLYYDNNNKWESLLIPSLYQIIKYDVKYESINYDGNEIIVNINNTIIVLDILTISNSVNNFSINLRLENNIEQNGKLIYLIVSPRLKELFSEYHFKITSNFVDASSQGISVNGDINTAVSETSVLLRDSGSNICIIGLIYENQPYFNIISGSFDYN